MPRFSKAKGWRPVVGRARRSAVTTRPA
jgi:hypothetical protein